MTTVNLHEAKTHLSRLVDEAGAGAEIIIARHGRPAARLVPLAPTANAGPRIGIAKGRFTVPASIDVHNDEVAKLFTGSP